MLILKKVFSCFKFSYCIFLACDAIILHNTYRANHNADPFVIPTKELCDHAQEWADTQADANLPTHTGMTHATSAERPGEGENMAWHSMTGVYAWDMSDATKAWQEEDAWWDFDNFQVQNYSLILSPARRVTN